MTHRRNGQRGSAMVVVLAILAALLAGGAVAVYLQLSDTRSSGLTRRTRDSLYCAEAGLNVARAFVAANYASWDAMLDTDPANDPDGYPITGDIDVPPDGEDDFVVVLKDNDDEPPDPGGDETNNPNRDADLKVFMVSRCTKYSDTPREVMELVLFQNLGGGYRDMAGFSQTGSGNRN